MSSHASDHDSVPENRDDEDVANEIHTFQPEEMERLKLVVEAWKTTVDVQKHFNDLEMRVRNFALTLVTAILAAAAFTISEDMQLTLFGYKLHLGAVIIFAIIPVWIGFYFMDRFWYHKLLLGAVKHGSKIEQDWGHVLPELSLADAISEESPINLCCFRIRSNSKMNIFYWGGILLLAAASWLVQTSTIQRSPNAGVDTETTSGATDEEGGGQGEHAGSKRTKQYYLERSARSITHGVDSQTPSSTDNNGASSSGQSTVGEARGRRKRYFIERDGAPAVNPTLPEESDEVNDDEP